jgi:dihydropyrimidine dehydrogenase (NAD+) subunit PreA
VLIFAVLDLETRICLLQPNCPRGRTYKRAAKAGWAGAIIKTIGPSGWPAGFEGYKHPRPSFWITSETRYVERPSTLFAFQNICNIDMLGKTRWIKSEMQAAKESGIPIIASITAAQPEEWTRLARMMEEAGADMVEMNVSCPYTVTETGMGMEVGQDPLKLREAVKATKEGCSLPVMVKLSPNITPVVLTEIAKTAEAAGADAISATNTLLGIIGINIETGIPISSLENKEGRLQSVFSGISGPAIKPVSLRCVAQIAQSVKIPISGIGGITDWKSAVEFIMVGAKTVQLATAPMVFGYGIIKKLVIGLQEFMEKKGYKSLDDFCGVSLRYFGPFDNLKYEQPIKAVVNEEKCTGCSRCVASCDAGGNNAIRMEEGVAKVDPQVCWGCNLCTLVCPEGAIFLS